MALAATAILAASCAKEVMTKDEFFEGLYEKCTIEADATLPGSGDADSTANTDKAYLDGNGKVIWQIGDRLNINGTSLTVATIDSGGICAKFYGTVNGIVDGSYRRFWAAYPATNFAASFTDPNSLSFTLPATQTINPSNHSLQGYTYMVGYTRVPENYSRLHFQMRNMGSVLKLTLKANANDFRKTVDKIEFTSNANLTGTFRVDSNSTSPTISQVSGSNTLVVNFTGGGLDISSQKTIYVFLPPLSGKSLTMRIYGGYGFVPYVEKTTSNITLQRSKKYEYSYPDITFDKVFTVASGTKVIFSPGTLQWSRTNGGSSNTTHVTAASSTAGYNYGTWRFAPNQWNRVGKANNEAISINSTAWIDLFGWGTSGYNSRFPWLVTTSNSSYGQNANINSTNYDWGTYNAIYNPKTGKTDPPGTWRTPTKAEWDYLLNSRSGNRFAKATVNGQKGIIIFPDGWNNNTYPLNNKNSKTANFDGNTVTAAQWTTLEQNGCVFQPACGYRWLNTTYYSDVRRVVTGSDVYCWSGTYIDGTYAWHLWVDGERLNMSEGASNNGRRNGYAVRLVRTHN